MNRVLWRYEWKFFPLPLSLSLSLFDFVSPAESKIIFPTAQHFSKKTNETDGNQEKHKDTTTEPLQCLKPEFKR